MEESAKPHLSGNDVWLDAHRDPIASFYTFSSAIALEDLYGDGDFKLLVGDLGSGEQDSKLKIYKGTNLIHEAQLLDLTTAVCTFMIDTNEPAVAVCSGTTVLIYKTIRPYFRFTLPSLEINSEEKDYWQLMKDDKIDPLMLQERLKSINKKTEDPPLTSRSLTYIQLEEADLQPFVYIFKQIPLQRQTVVTCMTILNKSHTEEGAASCLVVGTEDSALYILDPAAFTYLSRNALPNVPVILSATGVFDVDYTISVACRDCAVYNVKKNINSFVKIPLSAQACGVVMEDKSVIVGTMAQKLTCYSQKGKCVWNVSLPDCITAMEKFHQKLRNFKAVMIALRNQEIHLYKDKYLVNRIVLDEVIVGMRFGRFSREDNALVLISEGGAINVKILKRGVVFEPKESSAGLVQSQALKLNIPKKTKMFVDQTVRERDTAPVMHRKFQHDLLQLRMNVANSYLDSVQSLSSHVRLPSNDLMSIHAQVQGVGPSFKLVVTVQNISLEALLMHYIIVLHCDCSLYKIEKKLQKLPLLVPSSHYSFSTTVECINDFGQTDIIKIFIHCNGNPIPLLTAFVDMPISESVVL